MSDLTVDGETRVYWLPDLPDPAAPTREQIEGGVEVGYASLVEFAEDEQAVFDEPLIPAGTITVTFRVDTTEFICGIRRASRATRQLERALRKGDPALSVMHAAYARRRKARGRR